jgi:hypothetical protein
MDSVLKNQSFPPLLRVDKSQFDSRIIAELFGSKEAFAREVYSDKQSIIDFWPSRCSQSGMLRAVSQRYGEASGLLRNILEVHNPEHFVDAVEKFDPTRSYTTHWWQENFQLTNGYNAIVGSFMGSHAFREVFTDVLSFSIPTTEALASIAKFTNGMSIVEYLAGTGYWSWLLQNEFNVKVICTDKTNERFTVSQYKTFLPVLRKRIGKPIADTVSFISWVPYTSSIALPFLQKMSPDSKLVWIGEGYGGCCADDKTYEYLDSSFECVESVPLVQFPGLHDNLYLYRKLGAI